ncbi:tetratricopeptide repeat (TPR)-like superfamily protein [Actinidia rufa]|uniref:Tetratricopeptide repeat (TPR)-like superfamily protein n=1 Tax=Actinidia rufa TaxID=165716 RepID=A0A7J0GSK3_9ERIC|nr:tetratricopeptide repeat (TPR)-like superfamily protein [Actinidia rufa]
MFDPWSTTMATSPSLAGGEKRHWWLTNRKIVYKYVKDARVLIATQEQSEIGSALNLLDAALALSPRLEVALELKARSLLCLRRFKDVADMLQDYIPSLKMAANDSSSLSSDNSSQNLSRERVNLLSGDSQESDRPSFKCFSVSDLKKKVMAGLCKNCDKEGQWRYLVLGQACCHLGLMEDAMLLLQTGKRLATAAFRRESICCHIKLLLRRKTAAIAALDAGLYSEAIRHFSKIVDGRRGAPQAFLAECYMYRASAYRSTGRITESIADCNRTLALDPTSIEALNTRASLFETIRCLPDSLHDLEHLKLLYNSILRDRKLPGPAWKRHNVQYRESPRQALFISGQNSTTEAESCVRRNWECAKFADQRDVDSVRDRAKLSALLLYRLIQKGYTSVMTTIMDEESVEKQRKKAAAALQDASIQVQQSPEQTKLESELGNSSKVSLEVSTCNRIENKSTSASVFQGVFCRDLAVVGNLLSQVGFNSPIPVKYEALSC